ncbi:hypothetical protein QBC47DRAFT_401907 [Echria macrotheca]|uniref:Uncharacterized protein n=1 Tax=Echria macrotheca TaxID=438768 RepID=A0AAJ0F9U9_9PEZI|nr:hypothetical protein QBC47DRAFT_401907 [Echria macrotheca]
MPNRQYFCWKLCLKFNCGCIEHTSTQHVCNTNRGVSCNQWMITCATDKDCDTHRIVGLHSSSSSSEETSSQQQRQEEEQPETRRLVRNDETGYDQSGGYEQAPRRRAVNY